jgi:hypothetical protein
MPILKVTSSQHGATLNDLAERGVIAPVEFTAPDGVRRVANSAWAASDWLKLNGFYAPGNKPIVYHLEEEGEAKPD